MCILVCHFGKQTTSHTSITALFQCYIFQDLQPQVKLKLLLSLFHIPRRNLEAWKSQLDGILAVAKEDSEPWVCMLAELIKTFPETGNFSSFL